MSREEGRNERDLRRGIGHATRDGGGRREDRAAVNLTVNGELRTITVEPRTTLLERSARSSRLTGTKKACDRGECGAFTGERTLR
jgi:xanthine dehydrogenase YagT iron-sulfur-binding subunit